jgi:hypothetical protein
VLVTEDTIHEKNQVSFTSSSTYTNLSVQYLLN